MPIRTRAHFQLASTGLAKALWTSGLFLSFSTYGLAAPVSKGFESLHQLTIEQAPELRATRAEAEAKKAARWNSLTKWLPRLDLQLSQTRSKDYSFLYSGMLGSLASNLTPQESQLSGWALNATWPIYRDSVFRQFQISSTEKELAELKLEKSRGEWEMRLRAVYGPYLISVYSEAVLRKSLLVATTNYRDTELRFKLGQKTKIDLLRSRSNVLSLEARQIQMTAESLSALNQLIQVSGLMPEIIKDFRLEGLSEADLEVEIARFTTVTKAASSLDDLAGHSKSEIADRVQKGSRDYKINQLEEELALHQAKLITTAEWPELNFRASLEKRATEFSRATESGNESYSMGVVLTVPLFSWGSFWAAHSQRVETEVSVRILREKSRNEIIDSVERDLLNLRAQMRRVEALRTVADQNEELERLSAKSYELGKTTLLEFLTAQNSNLESKIELAKARQEFSQLVRRLQAHLSGLKNEDG